MIFKPMRDSAQSSPRVLLLAVLPALVVAVLQYAAWPGYLSFDSAYQFWQARHLQFGDVAPPMMPALWALLLPWCRDTTGPMLLICLLYAAGFGYWAMLARRDAQRLLASMIAILGPLCPFLMWMLPHVWTDVLLAAACLLLSALAMTVPRRPAAIVLFLVLLCLATALRHNAICATAPLAIAWASHGFPQLSRLRRSAIATLLVVGACAFKAIFGMTLVTQRLDTWAVTPLHDLQAVSVATEVQRIPASLVGPGMDVAQLRAAFDPYSATKLFSGTRSGIRNPTISPLEPELRSALGQAWRGLWNEPAYWSHRGRLFRGLLGSHLEPGLIGLGDAPVLTSYQDNPGLVFAHPRAHGIYRDVIERLRSTGVFAAGAYLVIALVLAALRWRGLARHWRIAVAGLMASAWSYLLPLFVLAPSAESRYLLWPVLASWLVILLAIFVNGRPAADRTEGGQGTATVLAD